MINVINTKTSREFISTITEKELRNILDLFLSRPIPAGAKIMITVPCGDYSGQTLTIDECGGLRILWTEVS